MKRNVLDTIVSPWASLCTAFKNCQEQFFNDMYLAPFKQKGSTISTEMLIYLYTCMHLFARLVAI